MSALLQTALIVCLHRPWQQHFLETLSNCAAGMRVVVVCHYRTIHAFRMLLEDIPMERCPQVSLVHC